MGCRVGEAAAPRPAHGPSAAAEPRVSPEAARAAVGVGALQVGLAWSSTPCHSSGPHGQAPRRFDLQLLAANLLMPSGAPAIARASL
eukprot:13860503-Alexandrium_andersonii.AAC.1